MSLKLNKLVCLLLICVVLLVATSAVSAENFTNPTESIIVENTTNDVDYVYEINYNAYNNAPKDRIIGHVVEIKNYVIYYIPIINSTFVNSTSNNTGGSEFVNNGNFTGNIGGSIYNGNYAGINGGYSSHISGSTTVKFENSNEYKINTDLETALPVYDQPEINAHIESSVKKLNGSSVNGHSKFYSYNSTELNSKSIVIGFELNLILGNYEINLNLSIEYRYRTVKNSDVNIIDSNFLNNAASNNYRVILEDNDSNYTLFDTDFFNTVICKSTTNEIINSAITVYESNFARNSLLRIANESVIGNYRLGIVTFSYDLKSINDTINPAMGISIGHHKILSGSLSISNSYESLNNILTVDIGNYTVKDCLMISKNKIKYEKTIDDSLVIVGNL